MIKGVEKSIDELMWAAWGDVEDENHDMANKLIEPFQDLTYHNWRFFIEYYNSDRASCVRKIEFIMNYIEDSYSSEMESNYDKNNETALDELFKNIYLILQDILKAFSPITESMAVFYIVYKGEAIPKDNSTQIVWSEIFKEYSMLYWRNYDDKTYKRMHGKLSTILERKNKTPNYRGLYIKQLEEIEPLIEDLEKESYKKILSEVRSKSDLT